ncbi:MAG: aminodeoxychorismate synthase component I [Myxococcales bacterium]|nr:aminodeoxychorismate synthase component I [Myxococcales bacterium]
MTPAVSALPARSGAPIGATNVAVVAARELDEPCSPCAAYERFRGDPFPWLLESALARADVGRFSFVGASPELVLRVRDGVARIERPRAGGAASPSRATRVADPLDALRAILPPPPVEVPALVEHVPFVGGAVACLGYELGSFTEPVALAARDELGLDDLVAMRVDRVVVFDHESQRAFAVGLGVGPSRETARRAAERATEALAARVRGLRYEAQMSEERARSRGRTAVPERAVLRTEPASYAKAVELLLEQIDAGNVYQANLTQRIDVPFDGDPFQLYRALRRRNPAPFAACIELPEVAVLSSSPERFLRVDAHGRVQSRPIKGTRPRGDAARADAGLAHALAHSAKDRAENLMIVDLVRNDLGRACRTGSVRVPSLMAIEGYASVWQMVSTVEGELRDGCDAIDLVRASFPPGSMTGAPKIAAMRWIDRVEPVRRTFYAGALGYFDARGGIDTSVVIRTILLRDGRAHLHVGGGVVADSSAEGEYAESLDKASALLDALASAEG